MLQATVVKQIENTLQHLEKYLPLANVHMVDYFTKNVYYDFIPNDIRVETEQYGQKKSINAIYNKQTEVLPCLNSYVRKCEELTLKNTNLCLSFQQFRDRLQELGYNESQLKLDVFMKPKKSHEVEILSWVSSAIKTISGTSHIVDIGDGKGYLSSMLALHYKVPVLGVDASEINTNGAMDRANKLSKVWNGVVTNLKTRETTINLYKQVTKFVDERVNFQELISNVFLEKPKGIGLIGLHTCGNLTPTCLKIFNDNKDIKTICNVGCCYHFITEEFEPKTEKDCYNLSQIGFPMSNYLRGKKIILGRGARMVAAQSVERILDKKDSPNKVMFYRALFEIIIDEVSKHKPSKERQVGRFRKASPNFFDYVTKAAKVINLPLSISEETINKLYSDYEHRIDEMNLFYLVRCMLAPVIESLILLDRLLYLLEHGHNNSLLIQFFDPIVSPRYYGIVSLK